MVEVLGRMGIAAYIIGARLGFSVSKWRQALGSIRYQRTPRSILVYCEGFEMLGWLRSGTITFWK